MSRFRTFVKWSKRNHLTSNETFDDYEMGQTMYGSAQKYNDNIKKMLRLAGIDRKVTIINSLTREEEQHPIWEVASSQMARRVLVGNIYKELAKETILILE